MGFEPIPSAWKAKNLPLIYIRIKNLNIKFISRFFEHLCTLKTLNDNLLEM